MQRRRERVRAATAQEIKDIAREHMAEQGGAAISLRAIARQMGMTAGALYSYYDTRDDLITALIVDGYVSLAEALEAARDAQPAGRPADRLLAAGLAYRDWALGHPQEYQLVFGSPIPGYQAPELGPTVAAARRAGAVLLDLVAAAWPASRRAGPPEGEAADPRWATPFAAWLDHAYPGLPAAAVAFHLRIWARLHGMVALEIHGHLGAIVTDAGLLYREELHALLAELGLPDPPDHPAARPVGNPAERERPLEAAPEGDRT